MSSGEARGARSNATAWEAGDSVAAAAEVSIGFVGLGRMGVPMSARLIEAGHSVVGFDPEPSAGLPLADTAGFVRVNGLADLAGVGAVILMLPTSEIVEVVTDELLDAGVLTPEVTVKDMSSSEPGQTQALAGRLAADGITLLDAPVSGGVAGAQARRIDDHGRRRRAGLRSHGASSRRPRFADRARRRFRRRTRRQGHQQPDVGDAPPRHVGSNAVRTCIRPEPGYRPRYCEQFEREEWVDRGEVAPIRNSRYIRFRIRIRPDGQGHAYRVCAWRKRRHQHDSESQRAVYVGRSSARASGRRRSHPDR